MAMLHPILCRSLTHCSRMETVSLHLHSLFTHWFLISLDMSCPLFQFSKSITMALCLQQLTGNLTFTKENYQKERPWAKRKCRLLCAKFRYRIHSMKDFQTAVYLFIPSWFYFWKELTMVIIWLTDVIFHYLAAFYFFRVVHKSPA